MTRGQMAAFLVRGLGYNDAGDGDLFTDDDGSVFEADIDKLATAGVTRGCNPPVNDQFCPDADVTRGQMAAFLVRALGYTDSSGGNPFTDDDGSVFEVDIDKLATAGVTRGCNPPVNDQFCPDASVTRGQVAAFLHRAGVGAPSVTTETLPIGIVGEPYSAALHAEGGKTPYQWQLAGGDLPAGLSLAPTGVIAGTPIGADDRTFSVEVTDANGRTATASLALRVVVGGPIGFIRRTLVEPGRTNGSICLIEPEGGPLECITDGTGNEHALSWSPDRQQVAFTSYRNQPPVGSTTNLYVMNSDGSGVVALTADTDYQKDPAFSPDGTKIAFAVGGYGSEDIYTINVDGSGLTQLTNNGLGNTDPAWSPDGQSIAFVSTRDYDVYGFDIYVMDADGSNPRALTQYRDQDLNPDWSQDGRLITFDTLRGDGCNAVYVIDADGFNPRFVACGVEPDFSPDGTEIAYESWYGVPPGYYLMNTDLLVVNIDGSNPRDLYGADETIVEHPAWS